MKDKKKKKLKDKDEKKKSKKKKNNKKKHHKKVQIQDVVQEKPFYLKIWDGFQNWLNN